MDEKKVNIDWKRLGITLGIVLLTAIVVGGTVWYLMDVESKSVADTNKESIAALQKQVDELSKKGVSTETKKGEQITKLDDTYNLYKNYDLGFEIKVPREAFFSDAQCEYNSANNDHSYRPKEGIIPVKTFLDGDKLYIAPEYFHQLEGETSSGGMTYYSKCNKVNTSLTDLKNVNKINNTISAWKLNIRSVSSSGDVSSLIKQNYGSGCSLGETKGSNGTGTVSVSIKGDGKDLGETTCPINYMTALFYNEAKGKFVFWNLGQSVTFYTPEWKDGFDIDMRDSFKFL